MFFFLHKMGRATPCSERVFAIILIASTPSAKQSCAPLFGDPKAPQDAPKTPQDAPRSGEFRDQKWVFSGPPPQTLPRRPKTPKTAPRRAQDAPRTPQDAPQGASTVAGTRHCRAEDNHASPRPESAADERAKRKHGFRGPKLACY